MKNKECNERSNRSQKYQYILLETSWTHDKLDIFDYYHGKEKHNEQLLELKEQLLDRVIELAKEKLTKKQYRIFELTIQGYDQKEVSKMTGVNQSTICHTLNGVKQNYKNIKGEIKIYYCSGIYVKLKRMASEDIQIQNILKQIQDSMDNCFVN